MDFWSSHFSCFCRGYDGTLAMGVLPVALFASGHTYFVQRLHERMGLEVYCVHATFQYSGTTGKRHRMRERLLWVVVSRFDARYQFRAYLICANRCCCWCRGTLGSTVKQEDS